jgi:DNA-binding MarR family transcriptional regulator
MTARPPPEEVLEFALAAIAAFHALRAAGRAIGAVTDWGGGSWGLLRTLAIEGPRTVPRIARARPVARQRIQRLADELAAAGLVAFVENPDHKRSKLLALTLKGRRHYAATTAKALALAAKLSAGLDAKDVRAGRKALAALRRGLLAPR